ncbi:MAG: hypothetical protein E7Z84_08085 [Methanosphaera stadtmanae]|nr:hypothetical protein [Methanosphaera stadtmanae]
MRLTPPYTAITIDFDDENITTTSNYAIIKVKDDYSPELLTFYLNSEYTKEQIYKFSEQTSVKVINISNIKNFDIKKIDKEPIRYENSYNLLCEKPNVDEENEMFNISYNSVISDYEEAPNIYDKEELYTQLVKTFEEKKKLIEKQLKLEKDLIEEIIFGE